MLRVRLFVLYNKPVRQVSLHSTSAALLKRFHLADP